MLQEELLQFCNLYEKLKNESFYILQVATYNAKRQYVPKEVVHLTKNNLYEILTHKHVFSTYEDAKRKADELNQISWNKKRRTNNSPRYQDDPDFNIPDECILE